MYCPNRKKGEYVMAKNNGERYSANSLTRGLAILKLFNSERPSLSLVEIAELLGVSRTVPYRLLYTLESVGYLRQNKTTKRYELTPKVLELGFAYLNSMELTEIAQPYLEELRDEYNVSCHLSILDGTEVVYIGTATLRGVTAINVNIGMRIKAYSVANGRVLLAYKDNEYIERHFDKENITIGADDKVVDYATFKNDLDKVRKQGYAISSGEFLPSISSIAVPVFGKDNAAIASINIVATDDVLNKLQSDGKVLKDLQSISEDLSRFQFIKA